MDIALTPLGSNPIKPFREIIRVNKYLLTSAHSASKRFIGLIPEGRKLFYQVLMLDQWWSVIRDLLAVGAPLINGPRAAQLEKMVDLSDRESSYHKFSVAENQYYNSFLLFI